MTIRGKVAAGTVVEPGMIEIDLGPAGGVMAGSTLIQVMLIGRGLVAGFTIQDGDTMIEGNRTPTAGIVAIRALIRPVICRRDVAGQAVRVTDMAEGDGRPHIRVMAVGAFSQPMVGRRLTLMTRTAVREV